MAQANEAELSKLLIEGCNELGLELSTEKTEKFLAYLELIQDWSNKMNLTGFCSSRDIVVKHFVDSLAGCILINKTTAKYLADVGSGAGFPGIPIALYFEDLNVSLMESVNKKCVFLQETVKKLEVDNASVHRDRAEVLGRDPQFRESFDYIVTRAVGEFNVVCEYCLPLVKVGGYFFAYKGPGVEEEIEKGKESLSVLSGDIEEIFSFDLPIYEDRRNIVKVKKVDRCPDRFPRKPGIAKKRPI